MWLLLAQLVFMLEGALSKSPNFWSEFYELEKGQIPVVGEEDKKLFAELEEAESVLVGEMVSQIPPPSPVHPMHQKLYLDKMDNKNSRMGEIGQPKTEERKLAKGWAKVRNAIGMGKMMKNARSVVKVYRKMATDPEWGQLMQRMYTDLIRAKHFGEANLTEFQQNCGQIMSLVIKDQERDIDKIVPYQDYWSFMRGSANTFLTMFKGGKSGQNYTERMLKMLKTIIQNAHIFDMNDGSDKGTEKEKKRRRRKRFNGTILLLAGIALTIIAIIYFAAMKWGKGKKDPNHS